MSIMYFLLGALALSFLIFIHELGHLLAAVSVGVKVEAFGIGFGPAIYKRKIRGVECKLGCIPFGGYVRLLGMDSSASENKKNLSIYDIKGSFFSKHPLKRIFILLAGPVSNVIIALVLFIGVWVVGGRNKNFSEITKVIGWVDKNSEFYKAGLRSGDYISECNGRSYKGLNDIMCLSVMKNQPLELSGFRIDAISGKEEEFHIITNSNTTSPSNIKLGRFPLGSARYLIYDRLNNNRNPVYEGSPMEGSGLAYGDRIVWMDGELVYSIERMNQILNEQQSLLLVDRGGKTFLSRQPRIFIRNLVLPDDIRNDMIDRHHEAQIGGKIIDMYTLPYILNLHCEVEGSLNSIEPIDYLHELGEHSLMPGDKIIAVDGVHVSDVISLFRRIQRHHTNIIVQRNNFINSFGSIDWSVEDLRFMNSFVSEDLQGLINKFNAVSSPGIQELGGFAILNPIEATSIDKFDLSKESRLKLKKDMDEKQRYIDSIKNREKRDLMKVSVEEGYKRLLLGVSLQDIHLKYNPNPLIVLGDVFRDSIGVIKALFSGRLHVKWLSGPVGIVQTLHHGCSLGLAEALSWIGIISMNLAVLNFLPIPALDGGYIALCIWELISRRRLNIKMVERLLFPFIIGLILLFIFLTFQDIYRIL